MTGKQFFGDTDSGAEQLAGIQHESICRGKPMEAYQKELLAALRKALFGAETEFTLTEDCYREALQQSVLPLLMSVELNEGYRRQNKIVMSNSIRCFYEHEELHRILTEKRIPYTVLKGAVSASYYPQPMLRAMGDVDFLVSEADVKRAGAALEENGFRLSKKEYDLYDWGYHRGKSLWELHWRISGIPKTAVGDVIQGYLQDIIEKAALTEGESGTFYAPSDFHHCLVLLLHSVHHLKNGGIGLRQLCDWAVFAAWRDVGQWEQPLGQCGLFRTAQVLTQLCVRYLGLAEQNWYGKTSEKLLEQLMEDVLNAGNFGKKDATRYEDGFLIGTEAEGGVSEVSAPMQLLRTLSCMTENHWPKTRNNPVLRLAGMSYLGTRYMGRVLTGKRRMIRLKNTDRAKSRKHLYASLHLFEAE